jgi:hypothetical protein
MSKSKASVFVCDEVFINLTGKQLAQGIYTTGDITVPGPGARAAQLVFVFWVECALENFPGSATFKVELPNAQPHVVTLPVAQPNPASLIAHPQRKISSFMQPVLVQQPVLNLGAIKSTVIMDGEEVSCEPIWITSLAAITSRPS